MQKYFTHTKCEFHIGEANISHFVSHTKYFTAISARPILPYGVVKVSTGILKRVKRVEMQYLFKQLYFLKLNANENVALAA